ncbi:hypothetical protein ON010_g18822 [Phytophthora cinnamomi]|nr:hypothetical protein ON010_g18822 [Phytophthora cinnamomi]
MALAAEVLERLVRTRVHLGAEHVQPLGQQERERDDRQVLARRAGHVPDLDGQQRRALVRHGAVVRRHLRTNGAHDRFLFTVTPINEWQKCVLARDWPSFYYLFIYLSADGDDGSQGARPVQALPARGARLPAGAEPRAREGEGRLPPEPRPHGPGGHQEGHQARPLDGARDGGGHPAQEVPDAQQPLHPRGPAREAARH